MRSPGAIPTLTRCVVLHLHFPYNRSQNLPIYLFTCTSSDFHSSLRPHLFSPSPPSPLVIPFINTNLIIRQGFHFIIPFLLVLVVGWRPLVSSPSFMSHLLTNPSCSSIHSSELVLQIFQHVGKFNKVLCQTKESDYKRNIERGRKTEPERGFVINHVLSAFVVKLSPLSWGLSGMHFHSLK